MIGNDIIYLPRFEKMLLDKPGFATRFFTERENELFRTRKNDPKTIAGNLAVKEALSKALQTGIRGFSLKDIEVLRSSNGAVEVFVSDHMKESFQLLRTSKVYASISHDGEYVFAVVLLKENHETNNSDY